MIRLLFIFVLSLFNSVYSLNGQIYQNLNLNIGKESNPSSTKSIIKHDSSLYIIGSWIDTSSSLSNNGLPYIAELDFSGNVRAVKSFTHHTDSVPHVEARRTRFAHKEGEAFYHYTQKQLDSEPNLEPYLVEFNIKTGEIVNSKEIPKYIIGNDSIDLFAISVKYFNDTIYLLSSQWTNSAPTAFIEVRVLDTLFNDLTSFSYSRDDWNLIPYNIFIDSSGIIEVVGVAWETDETFIDTSTLYKISFDLTGQELDFQIREELPNFSFASAEAHLIRKNIDDSWIISGLTKILTLDSCQNCFAHIPSILHLNSSFDSIFWKTEFYDSKELVPHNRSDVFDNIILSDNSGVVSVGRSLFNSHGFAFKCSPEGDSLWYRSYTPLNLHADSFGALNLLDIIEINPNSFAMIGQYWNAQFGVQKAWYLMVDQHGCLVPGCHLSSSILPPEQIKTIPFEFFPNPAQDYISILSRYQRTEEVNVIVRAMSGSIIDNFKFTSMQDAQYTLSLDAYPKGMFLIEIRSKENRLLHTEKIVHQ